MYGIEYRPLDFASVLGLSDVKDIISKILASEMYDPGYLFVGDYSSGKTTIVRIFARSILCSSRQPDMSPCNSCQSCKDFLEGRHPGYMEVDATSCGKEEIKQIKESLRYESLSSKKIILFDEAHGISREGKDALLKQLEISDPNVILMFGTTEVDKMPEQLRSRLMEFQLPEPAEQDVVIKLTKICEQRSFSYDVEALHLIVQSTGRHYRDAENKLRQVSLLGDITPTNVKKVTNLYIDEVAGLLLTLPYDLSKALKIADYLSTRMSIRLIYGTILRLYNDTVKYMCGIEFDSVHYRELLGALSKQYGYDVFEVVDYILSKGRLDDLTFFVSDLLVMHYRFLKGSFEAKSKSPKKEVTGDSEKQSQERVKRDPVGLKGIEDLPPHKREDAIREYKRQKREETLDERVPERVSEQWGPEMARIPGRMHRRPVSRGEFQKIVGGSSDGEKI